MLTKKDEEPKPILEPQVEDVPVVIESVKENVPQKKDNGWVWMLVAFALGAVVGTVSGYMVAQVQESKVKTQNLTTVQTSPVPSASPAAAEVKRADLKVQVLNGSGVAGAAAKAKTFLEGLGYLDVATGNADGDFAETEVELREDKASASGMLTDDLKDEYTLAETVGVLDESSDYDVVITLGVE